MEWPDGRVIEGTFTGGVLSGQGRFAQPDGTVFTGYFVGGMRHGTVRTTHPDGAWTEDRWVEDRLAEPLRYGGPGFTCERGDCFDGQGSVLWANGDAWEGEFRKGAMAGVGPVPRAQSVAVICEGGLTSEVRYDGASGALRMYRGESLVAEFAWRPGPEFDRAVAAWWGWFSP